MFVRKRTALFALLPFILVAKPKDAIFYSSFDAVAFISFHAQIIH